MTWQQSTPASNGNFDALLGSGRSIPSASFKGQFPIRWEGTVEDAAKKPAYKYDPSKPGNRGEQQFWPDGNPVENLWITLQTNVRTDQDDDGRRVLVLDSKNKIEAVQNAVRESGASFAKGGYLVIEWYGVDPNGKNPDNPPKLYRAQYTGPTLDGALGVGGPQAAPAPQAQGGWGQQQAPNTAQAGWGAPAAPQAAPAQYSPVQAQETGNGWGAPAPAQQAPSAWAPAPAAAPEPSTPEELQAALRRKGVPLEQITSLEQAQQVWAVVKHQPDVA